MTEIPRREAEMSARAEALRKEMAGAVRLLGSDGRNADEANDIAARLSGLPRSVIERLRWRKVKRPFADVTDAVREAVAGYNRRAEARARHEADILRRQLASLAALADNSSDPEFYRARLAGAFDQACRAGVMDRALAEGTTDNVVRPDDQDVPASADIIGDEGVRIPGEPP